MRRVAHRLNTEALLRAALHPLVDMLEFDVLPERTDGTGALLLAHDYADAAARGDAVLTLEQGLDLLLPLGIDLDVDLKLPGYELQVVDALRARGALDRVLVSTMERRSLRLLRAHAPEVRLGWSVPRLRRDPLRSPVTVVPAYAYLWDYRRRLPGRAAAALRAGEVEALMAHHRLVTESLVRAIDEAGGELFAWTVDDAARIAELEAMGVHGVITNDPRLFGAERAAS
jgi:glycerophosphoryl diester phosphodiesterase